MPVKKKTSKTKTPTKKPSKRADISKLPVIKPQGKKTKQTDPVYEDLVKIYKDSKKELEELEKEAVELRKEILKLSDKQKIKNILEDITEDKI